MSWKGFKNWLLGPFPQESPLKDWEPGRILPFPTVPQEPAAWSDEEPTTHAVVETATSPKSIDGTSDPVSDESEESGNEMLTHADDLPSSTFRVFPSASNHRNSYDSAKSARGAVAQRRRWYELDGIKVYEAETAWRDVTDEYVKP